MSPDQQSTTKSSGGCSRSSAPQAQGARRSQAKGFRKIGSPTTFVYGRRREIRLIRGGRDEMGDAMAVVSAERPVVAGAAPRR